MDRSDIYPWFEGFYADDKVMILWRVFSPSLHNGKN